MAAAARHNWTVSEVARRSGVSVATLHFYERKGLICSLRSAGNQRRYSRDVIRRVSVIRAAQGLGLRLAEVAEALAGLPTDRSPGRADWERVARAWRAGLDARILALQRLRDSLSTCIGCGCLSLEQCPLLNRQDHLAQSGPGPVLLAKSSESPQNLPPAPLEMRPIRAEDTDWLIELHRDLYLRDEGFDASFGDLVATAVNAFLRDHDPTAERGWIAWQDTRRVGSIFCVRSERPATARLRLFLLMPELRGTGRGRQMLEHCLAQARAMGYQHMLLSTYDTHTAACRLYERSGFHCTRTEPVHAHGRAMRILDWERDL